MLLTETMWWRTFGRGEKVKGKTVDDETDKVMILEKMDSNGKGVSQMCV